MNAERKVLAGIVITLTCGAIIIASTFMPWMGFYKEGYNVYGSAWEHIDLIRNTEHNALDFFIDRGFGNIIFTGYLFIIVGALLVLASIILLFKQGQTVLRMILFLSLVAAFISALNVYSISTVDLPALDEGTLVGIGLYISLAFSVVGIAGYFIIYSGIINKTMAKGQV
jgi:hypothetical protein